MALKNKKHRSLCADTRVVLGMQSSCAAVIKSSELTLWEDSWMAECVHESMMRGERRRERDSVTEG